MSLYHHLLNKHTIMSKGNAQIVICGPRLWPWSRRCDVWLQRDPLALWERIDDLGNLETIIAAIPQAGITTTGQQAITLNCTGKGGS